MANCKANGKPMMMTTAKGGKSKGAKKAKKKGK
jgi:hypothetical protein